MKLAEAIGDLQSREESLDFLASLLYYRGDFSHSRELFAQVQRSAMHTNSLLHHSWGLLGQGQNALRMGSLADAAGLLDEPDRAAARFAGWLAVHAGIAP